MNILALTRPTTKPEDDEVPDLASYENPTPRRVEPARIGCVPGASRGVVDELRAETVGQAWDRALFRPADPAVLIQHALRMAIAPIEALLNEPGTAWDFAERADGAQARAHAHLTRLTGDMVRTLNFHKHAVVKPIITAQRELLDVADFAVLDTVMVRQGFAAVGVAIEDAYVTHAAEWILAGIETGAEAAV